MRPPLPPITRLIGLLAVSEAGYLALLRLDAVNGLRPVLTFVGLMAGLFLLYATAARIVGRLEAGPEDGRVLGVVAVGAVLFRLTLLPAGLPPQAGPGERLDLLERDLTGQGPVYERFLLYDSDLWRYLWDGHVWSVGINPYRHPPASERLDRAATPEAGEGSLWEEIRDRVNHPEVPTVYPPGNQYLFRVSHALAPGSVLVWKGLVTALDLLAVLFVGLALSAAGRSPALALLYGWNPLAVKVFAGSGHADALLAAALAATAWLVVGRRPLAAGAALGAAVLAKLAPVVLAPFAARRLGLRGLALAGGVVLAGFLPFAGAGTDLFAGLAQFAREWRFNAGPYGAFAWIGETLGLEGPTFARWASAVALGGVLSVLVLRDDGAPARFAALAATALGALLVLGPAVMPWYVAAILPLAVVGRRPEWLVFSGLLLLAFLVMIDERERAWVLALEYGAFALCLAWAWRRAPLFGRAGRREPGEGGAAPPLRNRRPPGRVS